MDLNGGRPIKERPASPVILESQKFVRARIERRWLMLFKQTVEFLERQKPKVATVPEMVEDIMLKRRLQRSEAAWKVNITFFANVGAFFRHLERWGKLCRVHEECNQQGGSDNFFNMANFQLHMVPLANQGICFIFGCCVIFYNA